MAATSDASSRELLGQLRATTGSAGAATPAHVQMASAHAKGMRAAQAPAPPPGVRAGAGAAATAAAGRKMSAVNDAPLQANSTALLALLQNSSADGAAPGAPVAHTGHIPPPSGPPPGLSKGAAPAKKGFGRYIPAYMNPKYRLDTFRGSSAGKEDPSAPYIQFQKRAVRMGFIRKVYGILALQLIVTASIVSIFVLTPSVKTFVRETPGVFYAAWVVTIVIMISLVCCDDIRREYPANYVLLGLFTLTESYLLGAVSSFYDTPTLLMVLFMTATVVICMSMYAWQTKYDLTSKGGYLFTLLVVLVLVGICAAIIPDRGAQIAYAALGTCLFGAFIVYDTQLLMGGAHRKYKIGPDEYVFATLNLYLDVVNVFVLLLVLVGGKEAS